MNDSWVSAQAGSLQRDVPATAEHVAALRCTFRDWLIVVAPGHRHEDLVLAVYEALANAAEHAYVAATEPGILRLHAHRTGDVLHITVCDHGTWREPHPAEDRGRGIAMIRALTTTAHIDRTPEGTTVRMQTLAEPGP